MEDSTTQTPMSQPAEGTPMDTTSGTPAKGKRVIQKTVKKTPGEVVEGKGLEVKPSGDAKKKGHSKPAPTHFGRSVSKMRQCINSEVPHSLSSDSAHTFDTILGGILKKLSEHAVENCKMDGRKTVQARDFDLACTTVLGNGELGTTAQKAGQNALYTYNKWRESHPVKRATPKKTVEASAC